MVELAQNCWISAVNTAEVIAKLVDFGWNTDDIDDALLLLGCESVPFDEAQARLAGHLQRKTRPVGLSLGDRACLALALSAKAHAYTADSAWSKLAGGPEIRLIR